MNDFEKRLRTEPDTPCVLINKDTVKKNIQRLQAYCNKHTLLNRPHIKTHKLPEFAKAQLAAGAWGITCQKVSEAEVFADAGCNGMCQPVMSHPRLS